MANVHDAKQGDLDFEKDFVIIFMNEANIDDFKPILEVITQRRVQRTLAVLSEEQTYQMKNDLSDVQSNSNFFLLKVKVCYHFKVNRYKDCLDLSDLAYWRNRMVSYNFNEWGTKCHWK